MSLLNITFYSAPQNRFPHKQADTLTSTIHLLSIDSFYHQTSLFVCSEIVATSIFIILLNIPLLLLRQGFMSVALYPTPFWVRLGLVLDTAIEFPLIFAFHPTTIAYHPRHSPPLPKLDKIMLQVAVFFAIELAFDICILRSINISLRTEDPISGFTTTKEAQDDDAEGLVTDFLRPRGTLLLAIALLGMPTALTAYAGQLHPVAMVLWVVLEQLVKFREVRCSTSMRGVGKECRVT